MKVNAPTIQSRQNKKLGGPMGQNQNGPKFLQWSAIKMKLYCHEILVLKRFDFDGLGFEIIRPYKIKVDVP